MRVPDAEEAGRRRLLIVDDEEANVETLIRAFRGEFEVHRAGDGQEALTIARSIKPDVIITDQRMPNMTGVDFLDQLGEDSPHAVRIMLTGYADYRSLVDAVNIARVDHYLEKPFHIGDLKTVVGSLLRAADLEAERDRLLTRLEAANAELARREVHLERLVQERTGALEESNRLLHDLAVRDGMTGLFNHRYLVEHLEIELARSRRYDRELGILFIDIDDFKRINDQYGHAMGDRVLRAVAEQLRSDSESGRRSDLAARYGGEEFCMILPETGIQGTHIKAERVRLAIESIDAHTLGVPEGRTATASIGAAVFPGHGDSVDALLQAADAALYQAKRAGKNQVRMAERA